VSGLIVDLMVSNHISNPSKKFLPVDLCGCNVWSYITKLQLCHLSPGPCSENVMEVWFGRWPVCDSESECESAYEYM
jgi:hypothetical protein